MAKSEFAAGLDEIQDSISALMKREGFRRRGRSYNRLRNDEMVQVVNLQMGEFPIGDYVVPGLRGNLYGKFAINLGVTLPCVQQIANRHLPKAFYQEYDCEIRARLTRAQNAQRTEWWQIEPPYVSVGNELAKLIEAEGLTLLNQFTSYQDVIRFSETHPSLPGVTDGRSALDLGILHSHKCDSRNAAESFARAKNIAQQSNHKGFFGFVVEIEAKCLAAIR